MPAAKPSLELLRELSDENVLTALLRARRLTRAQIAARAGISKPTVAESVRRLVAAGVVVDTGDRTTGPGRVGAYYALSPRAGLALVVDIAAHGVTAELVDAHGDVLAEQVVDVGRPARPAQVAAALRLAGRRLVTDAPADIRLAVVSAADPVDRTSGRLVHLPDSPFLVGELAAADVLTGMVDGAVTVDNDVNWAARAERDSAPPGTLDDVVYLHLGEGLGAAVIADGEVRRGHGGLTGEIAHVVTTGRGGRAVAFTEVFAQLGLRRDGGTAVDTDAVLTALHARGTQAETVRATLVEAVAGVVAAAVAFADPAAVVIGGSWGSDPHLVAAVAERVTASSRPVAVHTATVTARAPLTGARAAAVTQLRAALTRYRHTFATHDRAVPGGVRPAGPARS